MKEKNLILAVALSLGVYVAWFALVEKKMPASSPATAPVAAPAAPAPSAPAAAVAAGATRKENGPRVELKTADAEIAISPLGAAISSYRYRGPLGWVELVLEPSPGLFSTGAEVPFSPEDSKDPKTAVFAARSKHFVIRKEFRFEPAGAMSHIRLTIQNVGKEAAPLSGWELSLGPGLGTVASEEKENPKLWRAIALSPAPPGRTQPVLDQLKEGERTAPWKWLALDNRYFLAAALASPQDFDKVRTEPAKAQGHDALRLRVLAKPVELRPGETKTYDIPFYLGPKSYSRLESLGAGLERSVNFGWFDTLGRWTLKLLQVLHGVTGNYGWSIILLTILIQTALFPLTFKSLQSMNKMRNLQPEIAKLQQKYKDDAQRLNTEMMALYKSKGVNPMGGCLPMLAQMPIFVALFNALRNAWELHGAPWVFWVHDLSAHDPFYVLPLVMGGVMYLQNQMNPAATADPAQANMMKFMPVIFTFMFIKFPAGLVLYWLTNSILSTLQQLALKRQLS